MVKANLFESIKILSPYDAVKAVADTLLSRVETKGLCNIIDASLNANRRSPWMGLALGLEALEADRLQSKCPHTIQKIENIIRLCKTRHENDKHAQCHFSDPQSLEFWRLHGHLQPNTLKPLLLRWAKQWDMADTLDMGSFTRQYGRWWGLVQYVKSVQELAWPQRLNPPAETVESVLLYMLKTNKAPLPDCDIFGKCEYCWRFVPLCRSTAQNHLYCAEHEWNTFGYKRALKLEKVIGKDSIQNKVDTLYIKSKEEFIAHHQNLPEHWQNLLAQDVVALSSAITNTIEYHPVYLHMYFPNVCATVKEHGGDIANPHDIIETLDPIRLTANDTNAESIRQRWEALHTVFASNLALFRRELCHAEILLSIHKELFSDVKRGGYRPRKAK